MKNAGAESLNEKEISDIVINSLPGIFYLQDQSGRNLRWNKNFELISGYTGDEIRQLNALSFFDPKDHERLLAVIQKAFEEGAAEIEIETVRKDGVKIPYYFNGKSVYYEGQLCLIGMGIDISGRIDAEKQILKNQERLNYHINNSPLAVIEYDKDLRITFWSNRARDMFGWSEEEVLGKKATEFLIHEDDIIKMTENLLLPAAHAQEKGPLPNRNYTRDGRILYCRWHNSLLTNQGGNIETIMSIIRDITDLEKAERLREEMANDLMRRNNELEQFTYIVSHNLRAPVASLIGLADVLTDFDMTENEKKEITRGISHSAQRLDSVIKDLNDILHVKNNLNTKKETVGFSRLVAEIEQSLRENSPASRFVLETDFENARTFYTLKHYLNSIFINLISNSIKYGQPDVQPVIKIRSEVKDRKLVLTFKDNGIGFDLSKTGNDIFGLYKRFHFHVEGKGLGLFMVKTQVGILGGKITVSSEVNKGSEFRIEFDV